MIANSTYFSRNPIGNTDPIDNIKLPVEIISKFVRSLSYFLVYNTNE